MLNFSFHNPTRIHFGAGEIQKIAQEIPKDAKIMLLYGGGSIKNNGVYQQVIQALEGFNYCEFAGIEPNPSYKTLMDAVELGREKNVDYLLAVGGGSVIDGSKFVAAAIHFDGKPWDILEKGASFGQVLPIGCVLTLPATGSESNGNSVVTDDGNKLAFSSNRVRPVFAILDPAVSFSLSPRQVGNGVVDAFVHVMEQYLTYSINARVQDGFSETLLKTLIEEGPKALADDSKDDVEIRANIMWSASIALNGLLGAGVPQDWATHMIGHELTGRYGIDHARTLSIVLPAVLKYCKQDKRSKLIQFAENVWQINSGSDGQKIDQAIAKTEAFFQAMEVPTRLADVDLDAACIDGLVDGLKRHGMTALGEHQKIGLEQSREILNLAL